MSVRGFVCLLHRPCFPKHTYEVKTIETASLRMDSPKTNMFKTGSTSRAEKIASVATGSTAEMRDPKAKDSTSDNR